MKHKTQKEMETLLQSYKSYRGTQKDFCKANGIKANQLHYWRKKLSKTRKLPKGNKFIPLEIADQELPRQIEISYSNGTIVRVPVSTSIHLVEHLLQIRC